MKSVCNTMGIIVPIWNKFLLIHTSTNQITKVDCNAFLSESESIKLKSFVPFGRDSTLVSWIAIVRDWSKHRFRQRLWPVCEAKSEWFSPIFMKSSWLLVFNLEVMILQLSATSKPCWYSLPFTLASPHNTKAKKPKELFSLVKNFIRNL